MRSIKGGDREVARRGKGKSSKWCTTSLGLRELFTIRQNLVPSLVPLSGTESNVTRATEKEWTAAQTSIVIAIPAVTLVVAIPTVI